MNEGLDFSKQLTNWNDSQSKIPKILANIMMRYFLKNYKAQQWDGIPWEPRKKTKSNPLLIDSGKLYHSIKVTKADFNTITIETVGEPNIYAAVHNEGLRSGRGEGFIMPKRQFLGHTDELENKLIERIEEELGNIFN